MNEQQAMSYVNWFRSMGLNANAVPGHAGSFGVSFSALASDGSEVKNVTAWRPPSPKNEEFAQRRAEGEDEEASPMTQIQRGDRVWHMGEMWAVLDIFPDDPTGPWIDLTRADFPSGPVVLTVDPRLVERVEQAQ